MSRSALESWVSQSAPQPARVEGEKASNLQPTGDADPTKPGADDNVSTEAKSMSVEGAAAEEERGGNFDNSELVCVCGPIYLTIQVLRNGY